MEINLDRLTVNIQAGGDGALGLSAKP